MKKREGVQSQCTWEVGTRRIAYRFGVRVSSRRLVVDQPNFVAAKLEALCLEKDREKL